MTDDPLTLVRLDVAEMKGMLTQALGDHAGRLNNHEAELDGLHHKTNELEKVQAAHTVKLTSLDERSQGALGRVMSVVGPLLAAGALIVSIVATMMPP